MSDIDHKGITRVELRRTGPDPMNVNDPGWKPIVDRIRAAEGKDSNSDHEKLEKAIRMAVEEYKGDECRFLRAEGYSEIDILWAYLEKCDGIELCSDGTPTPIKYYEDLKLFLAEQTEVKDDT